MSIAPAWSVGSFCCPAHLGGDADGAACCRRDPHTGGHVYTDSHGSFANDRHAEGGHG